LLSAALHAAVFAFAGHYLQWFDRKPDVPKAEDKIVFMQIVQPLPQQALPEPVIPPKTPKAPKTAPKLAPTIQVPQDKLVAMPDTANLGASMAAPPAPTAAEWAFAAKYTNKNSKGYRYNWGQQVRSMMGTAVEGVDQGMVRFRLEIAPDGTLAKLETLWSTSKVAEQLARKAIQNMPPLPPTPTGKPLIFDKTISFTPYATGGPPIYKNDCLPDPSDYSNPFAWDGKSPQVQAETKRMEQLDPQVLADCLKQLPLDSVEAEEANAKGKMDRWGWGGSKLGR
jgi:TonB family protein